MTLTITRADLARMYPRALPAWLDALSRLATPLCEHYGFNRLDWCGIAGQIDAECDGLALAHMAEDMSYSAERMLKIYSKRLGDCVGIPVPPLGGRVFASKAALARALAHKPKELADVVYGGPHGREGTPPWCGSLYPGRGPLQETHANNYRAARDEICKQPGGPSCPDLLEHPELLATDPELGVRDVFAQWKLKRLSKYAQRSDWATLSDVLNTGNPNDSVKPFGLERRLRATARALAIWPADAVAPSEPTPPPGRHVREEHTPSVATPSDRTASPSALREGDTGGDVKRLQERLIALGFGPGPADGRFGVLTTRALVAFQAEHGLKPDGVAGARTIEVLAATAPNIGPHSEIGVSDLKGSSTIAAARRIKQAVGGIFTGNAVLAADDQMGLGIADAAIGKGEQIKGLIERGAGLGVPMPSGRVVVALAIAAGCIGLLRWASNVEWGRVLAARRGG